MNCNFFVTVVVQGWGWENGKFVPKPARNSTGKFLMRRMGKSSIKRKRGKRKGDQMGPSCSRRRDGLEEKTWMGSVGCKLVGETAGGPRRLKGKIWEEWFGGVLLCCISGRETFFDF